LITLRDALGRSSARWLGGDGFIAWWGRSLAAWLPRAWRSTLGMDRGRLLLHVPLVDPALPPGEPGALQLRLQDSDGLRDVGQIPGLLDDAAGEDPLASVLAPSLADLPRWLLLPAASVLRRRLLLPAAAAERLRDVVGFEIERQTPFAADAVAFDARILDRRESDGQLDVELVVVPRTTLDAQLAALGPLAASLAGIDVAAADAPLGVNLLAATRRRQQQDPWRLWNWVLVAVAVLAFAAMLWQMLDNRRAAAEALQRSTDQRVASARTVSQQRQQLVDLVEGRAFLDRARSGRPTAVEVLDELSRRLPDSTYLEKLSIENDHLLLIGLSSEASALVGRLEGAKLWHAPALTGAVQPDPRTGRDRFTLTAELAISPSARAPVQRTPVQREETGNAAGE
jgi:general secretion pathway protein L